MKTYTQIKNSNELGNIIHKHRKPRSSTMAVAELLNIQESTIEDLENGNGKVTLDTALIILDGIGLDVFIQPRGMDIPKIFLKNKKNA